MKGKSPRPKPKETYNRPVRRDDAIRLAAFMVSAAVFLPALPRDAAAQAMGMRKRRELIRKYQERRAEKEKKGNVEPAPEKDWLGAVSRGDLNVTISARGTVRAEDVFRLKSTIEGRIEEVPAKPLMWFPPSKNLAAVLNKELAALMDAKATTSSSVMTERWENVYQPTPIQCPQECFVLRAYAQQGRWVQPGALLFEAARKLRLVGRIPPGSGRFIEKNQIVTFWDLKNPKRKLQARIEDFILDIQGQKVESAGTFTVRLDSSRYLDPGTEWEGVIKTNARGNILRVPTEALIIVDNEAFLPVRVSTGVTTEEYTEITAGVRQNDQFLYIERGTDLKLLKHAPPPVVLAAPAAAQNCRVPETMDEEPQRPRRGGRKRPERRTREIEGFLEEEKTGESHDEFPSDLAP